MSKGGNNQTGAGGRFLSGGSLNLCLYQRLLIIASLIIVVIQWIRIWDGIGNRSKDRKKRLSVY